ncbi:MAG: hypothetical protein ACM3N5_11440 [Candidatus Eiseniibacteriota bacterium]
MSNHSAVHLSPAQVRAARAVLRDDRAPAAWKQAAQTLNGPDAAAGADLEGLLHAKGWQPVWGRYLLTRRAGAVKAIVRRLARP